MQSMSNERNVGPSPIRARTRSAYSAAVHVRSSSQVTISKPHSRGSSRSRGAYSEPRIPASTERRGSINPSSRARLNGVPWK